MKYQLDNFAYVTDSFNSTIDGIKIVYHGWIPMTEVKKIIFIHPGFGDHSGRYLHVVEALNDGETGFFSIDARGHGKSEGKRGYVKDFSEYKTDLNSLIDLIQEKYPNIPSILFGHSMGGAVSLDFCLQREMQSKLSGLVLSAPAIVIIVNFIQSIKQLIAAKLAMVAPGIVVEAGLDVNSISQDPTAIAAYEKDPLVHGKISFSLGKTFFEIGKTILANGSEIKLPIFIFHGTGDKIIDHQGSQKLYNQVASQNKTLKFYPGLYHEIFNESAESRKKPFDDLNQWIKELDV